MSDNKLFTEFPPVPTNQWEETIIKDLKGADYNKKLIWKTFEGFSVKPYYREEDTAGLGITEAIAGQFPFLRGNKSERNEWELAQDIWVDDPASANSKALNILNKGITSLRFHFSIDACNRYINEPAFYLLLNHIDLPSVFIHFQAGDRTKDILSLLKSYASHKGYSKESIRGTMNFDVLGHLTHNGKFYESEQHDFAALVFALQKARKHFPGIRMLPVNGNLFRNAGSGIVQEVAFSLAIANEYLAILSGRGVGLPDIFHSLHFTFAAGPVYFMEIAKLRAARMLYSRLAEVWGARKEEARMWIHSENSHWNKTIYDPYVNILRSTTEAMSVVLGGTDSLAVQPFDSCFKNPDEFSERIARNIQLILKEEAYLDRVADPSGGSYYIESLTDSIAQAAWELFRKTENEGGYLESLRKGSIQTQVESYADSRFSNISSRREIVLGTNQYPNFQEVMHDEVKEFLSFPKVPSHEKEGHTLHTTRGAEQIERMRLRTENAFSRPKVFLFPTGNLAIRLARSNFSGNFFAVAGFEIIDHSGFNSITEGIRAVMESKPDIVVLCSTDEDYGILAPELFEGLFTVKNSGNKSPILVIAGAPPCMEELKNKGINHFIHVRSNLLATLEQFQNELGI